MKKALVIAFDQIEEAEALITVDLLRRASIAVTLASVDGEATVTGRNAITFAADTSLALVQNEAFDLVFLPGGPGVLKLETHSGLRDLLIAQAKSPRLLAAICAAPALLAAHGILNSKNATAHASVRASLPQPSDDAVVSDGNIITSQGVGTTIPFALQLVSKLTSDSIAQEISTAIHYQK